MIELYQEFDSYDAAWEWRLQMYQAYPPPGYGTHIQIKRAEQLDLFGGPPVVRWTAHGSRAESCD